MPESFAEVSMLRPNLDDIPDYALPPGFTARWYQPGDERLWYAIERASEKHIPITPDIYLKQFGNKAQELTQRQVFILDTNVDANRPLEEAAVGTATAWFNESYNGRPYGRVHWVAIRPEYQGRGLSKPLMTLCLTRLRDLGHVRAYLITESVRIPAIHLYRRFGFVPEIKTVRDAEVWRAVERELLGANRA